MIYPKSRGLWMDERSLDYSAWNAHSNVIVRIPTTSAPFLWGPARDAPQTPVRAALAAIDGDAGTVITHWDGNPSSLSWVQYDVTSLPYRIRSGNVAIIGVGGGRDVLTAIWAGNPQITGIEINKVLVGILERRYRQVTSIADHPGVKLIHDEARSYLTRAPGRFDVLQMSLIDTWAATGAGAFTLSENGFYTREGWQVFLRALSPTGVFSVSRWYDPAIGVGNDPSPLARCRLPARLRHQRAAAAPRARDARACRHDDGLTIAVHRRRRAEAA